MQSKCDYASMLTGEYGDGVSVTRKDYQSSVKALFHIMECIYEIVEKGPAHESRRPQNPTTAGVYLSSDIDNTEMSNGHLNEIEEAKSD